MTTAADILKGKGRKIWSIGPEASVFEAIKLMADKEIGALLVKDGTEVIGIVSERDYTRKVILKGFASNDIQVRKIMTERVIYASSGKTVEECMSLMTKIHIRHLPIMGKKKFIGVLSMRDLAKAIIAEQQFMIERLEHFATTSGSVHKWVAKMEDNYLKTGTR